MKKRILLSGLLGGLTIIAWLIVSTGLLSLSGDAPEPLAEDKEIHSLLKERIQEPGIYFLPDHSEENQSTYPNYGDEPLYFITYGGRTPHTFLGQLIFELFCFFAAPIIAAWLLSMASEKILEKYSRRVLFVGGLGLFLAVFSDAFSEKPMDKIFLSAMNNLVMWVMVGLVIAWLIKPSEPLKLG